MSLVVSFLLCIPLLTSAGAQNNPSSTGHALERDVNIKIDTVFEGSSSLSSNNGVAAYILRGIGLGRQSNPASGELDLATNLKAATAPPPSRISLTAASGSPSSGRIPIITQGPKWSNESHHLLGTLPVTNYDFATVCAHNDTNCASICLQRVSPCTSSWDEYYSSNVKYVAAYPVHLTTSVLPSTNYSISTWASTEWTSLPNSTFRTREFTCTGGGCHAKSTLDWTTQTAITWELDDTMQLYAVSTGSATTMYYTFTVTDPQTWNAVTTGTGLQPTCSSMSCTIESVCSGCEVEGGTVELLYWSDMATNTAWMTATQPATAVTAVYKNHTLTSPTVYIEFQTAYATDSCGKRVGKAHPGALLPVNPKSLYSIQASLDYFLSDLGNSQTSSFFYSATFDFRDLHGLAPFDAYVNQPSCFAQGCYTVFDDYHPVLVLPTQVRAMDPAWKTCALDFRGAWDPPIALKPADHVAGPTTSNDPTHTVPPSPHSSVVGPASQTAPPSVSASPTGDPNAAGTAGSPQTEATVASSLSQAAPDLVGSTNPANDPAYSAMFGPESSDAADPSSSVQQATATFDAQPQPSSNVVADPAQPTQQVATTVYALPVPASSFDAIPSEQTEYTAAGDGASEADVGQTGVAIVPSVTGPEQQHESAPVATQASSASSTDPAQSEEDPSTESARPPWEAPVVAGHTISADSAGGLIVASTTLSAGGDALTFSSAVYSAVQGGGLVVSSEAPEPPEATLAFTAPVVAGQTVSQVGNDGLAVGGTTLQPGGDPMTISSAVYSAASGGGLVIVSDSPAPSSAQSPTNAYEVLSAAQSISSNTPSTSVAVVTGPDGNLHSIAQVSGGYALDGKTTLAAGQSATVSGFGYISAGFDGQVIGGGKPAATKDASPDTQQSTVSGAVFSIGSETYTAYHTGGASDGGIVLVGDTTTIHAGSGSPTTLPSGKTISYDSAGHLVIAGSTVTLSRLPSSDASAILVQPTSLPASYALLTLGSSAITAVQQQSNIVEVAGQTLTVGGAAMISAGHVISAASGGILLDGSTVEFASPTISLEAQAVLTLGSSATITAAKMGSSGAVEIGGQTLQVGGSAIVSAGHTLSAAKDGVVEDGTLVAFKTSTRTLPQAGSSASGGDPSLPVVLAGPTAEGSTPAVGTTAPPTSAAAESTGSVLRLSLLSWLLGSLSFLIIIL